MSPLHYACENGNLEIVRLLVVYGAHLHSEDESGKSPLEVAQDMENDEIVSFLHSCTGIFVWSMFFLLN
jgi:ankyrin repeat protein